MSIDLSTTQLATLALFFAVALVRVAELQLANRNRLRILARGGYEVGARHYPWMVLLHTAFLLAASLEVALLATTFRPWLAVLSLAIVLAAMALRLWVIATLGNRWTTRILVEPGRAPIRSGPFRWLRHPNYLAVVSEIAFLPLVHGAWRTSIVFTVLNTVLLRVRIGAEETAIESAATQRSVAGFKGQEAP